MMELLCENIQQLKTTTHFFKKLHQRCFACVTPLIMNVARYWESIPNKTEILFSVLAKKTQLTLFLLDNNRTYEMKSRTNEKNAFMLEKANRTKQLINQPQVSATEFMNNKMPHTLFETFFFLKSLPKSICQLPIKQSEVYAKKAATASFNLQYTERALKGTADVLSLERNNKHFFKKRRIFQTSLYELHVAQVVA